MVLPVPGGPHSSSDIGGVVVGQLPQRRPVAGQVPLADHLVQGPRPHPHGQRRGGLLGLGRRVIEQAAAGRSTLGTL